MFRRTFSVSMSGEKIFLSPAVHHLMRLHKVDISQIQSSGPKGRILKGDVLAYLVNLKAPPPPKSATMRVGFETLPISASQQSHAKRWSESKKQIPHTYIETKYCVDELLAMKSRKNIIMIL
jgi:pyruvate/2-oxoglutarate dehydrogenase complex dihydrolipoamide acyltransferase (E2) component